MTRRPTRRDLLVVIGVLQDTIGRAHGYHGNDRDPNGFERGQRLLNKAHDLCIRALGQDSPIESNLGPWGAPLEPR